MTVPTLGEASAEALAPLLSGLPLELRPKMETFIQGVYAVSTSSSCVIASCREAVVTDTRPFTATWCGESVRSPASVKDTASDVAMSWLCL